MVVHVEVHVEQIPMGVVARTILRRALPPAKSLLPRVLDVHPQTLPVCALRLAPLVFGQPGELRRAEWAEH